MSIDIVGYINKCVVVYAVLQCFMVTFSNNSFIDVMNTTYVTSIKNTPYEIVFGQKINGA